jgi:hypothetical protein
VLIKEIQDLKKRVTELESIPVKIWICTQRGAIIQIVTGNLVEELSAERI